MRSLSILVGRLLGGGVRLKPMFFVLPLFVFWTEYNAHGAANGSRDMALVGIILGCVAAHEFVHMLLARRMGMTAKAVILLPLGGVTLFDEPRKEKAPKGIVLWQRAIRLALVGPLASLGLGLFAAGIV